MATTETSLSEKHKSGQDSAQKETCNRVVYNIPSDWIDAMKKNNIAFSPFVKTTIRKELAKMKIII